MGVLTRQKKKKVIWKDGSCCEHIDRRPVEDGEKARLKAKKIPKTNPVNP